MYIFVNVSKIPLDDVYAVISVFFSNMSKISNQKMPVFYKNTYLFVKIWVLITFCERYKF